MAENETLKEETLKEKKKKCTYTHTQAVVENLTEKHDYKCQLRR